MPPDEEGYWWSLPVVAETWDGYLNDVNGFHVKPEDAFHALDTAKSGPVEEGSVGGGTGMICNEFKGGIGTSSRVLRRKERRLHGRSAGAMQLRTARANCESPAFRLDEKSGEHTVRNDDVGSIIVVVATDAPLIPTQLKRVARRVSLGLGRDGSYSGDGSGDIFIAFSTANSGADGIKRRPPVEDAAQRRAGSHFSGHRAGHRRSDRQRHGRCKNDERRQRSRGDWPAP